MQVGTSISLTVHVHATMLESVFLNGTLYRPAAHLCVDHAVTSYFLGQDFKMNLKMMRLLKITADILICPLLLLIPNRNHSGLCTQIRAHHETFNSRLKSFNILRRKYRHPIHHNSKIILFFNTIYLSIKNGSGLFKLQA